MTRNVSTPKADLRTQAQRARILTAAETCFVEHGFHAASMANIADVAGMSPGLIYRYFRSKSEIILAIIEQQLDLVREEMRQLDGSVDLADEIWKSFGRKYDEDESRMRPALFLEMSAEASRDPDIAAAVQASDTTLRLEFCEWLGRSRAKGGLGVAADKTEAVALMLQLVVEGMRVREVREPDLDRAALRNALREFLPILLSIGRDRS